MEHPLIGDISNLSLEELGQKINEINKRLIWARKHNSQLTAQLYMMLESYQNQYSDKQQAIWKKENAAGTDFADRIDIT
jgi:hypothetical protein